MRKITCYVLIASCCLASCNKSDFLNKKPSSEVFIPTTLDDFQLLLDNESLMSETPVFGEISSDNYYTTFTYWQRLGVKEQNAYIWAPDVYKGETEVDDWNVPYEQVFVANVILEGLQKLAVTYKNEKQWKNTKGSALFSRAYAFYNLAQIFAPVYHEPTADADLGIPLRLKADIHEHVPRASVRETYEQILSDLSEAAKLLEDIFPQNNRNRPSRVAAHALLARVYLSMRKYDKAELYADSSLKRYSTLIDYNTLNQTTPRPFDRYNAEVLMQSRLISKTNVIKTSPGIDCIVDSNLYQSYEENDLRKSIFFQLNINSLPVLKYSYYGSILAFSGLATDEMYLVRAECYAREGKTSEALEDLNKLMRARWKTGHFTPFTASTAADALNLILTERRKELVFRGLRWTDLRRFNKDGANIVLMRKLDRTTHTLAPNSRLYVLPIPPDVLQLGGIEQNERN